MSALPVPERVISAGDANQQTVQPAAPSYTDPAQRPTPRRNPAAPLRVVQSRPSAARTPFVLLVSGLLAAGLIGVLLVNTRLAQGSFAVNQLQLQQSKYADQVQALSQAVADAQAPQALGARAIALGMVPAPNPVFKRDGTVLGAATVARKPPPPPPPSPSWSPTPTPSPSATTSPSPTASTSTSASASVSASGSAKASPSASAINKPSTSGSPKASGSSKPTATVTPKPSTGPTPKPTAKTTAVPTAKPTAKPTGTHT